MEEVLRRDWFADQQEVLDLSETARFLRVSEDEVLRIVQEQALPARRVKDGWRFLKAAVCDWLRSGTMQSEARRESSLAVIGLMKDDPHAEGLLREIYEGRGRAMTDEAE
jgi:hypothetical protein